jgi:hypothetical protein
MLICKTVIDLSRLVVFYCPSAFTPPDLRSRFLEALFKASEWTMPWTTPIPKHRETNVLLLLRTVANSFQEGTPIGKGAWVLEVRAVVLGCWSSHVTDRKPDLQSSRPGTISILDKNNESRLGDCDLQVSCCAFRTVLVLHAFIPAIHDPSKAFRVYTYEFRLNSRCGPRT